MVSKILNHFKSGELFFIVGCIGIGFTIKDWQNDLPYLFDLIIALGFLTLGAIMEAIAEGDPE